MSAILGYLADPISGPGPAPSAWSTATAALASRSGPIQETFLGNGIGACYRAPDMRGFYQDTSYIVLSDGFPDQAGTGNNAPSPAMFLADLVRTKGVGALEHLSGNFAAVVVDVARRQVHLRRDHFGCKPLFWARATAGWYWGSEIKFLLPFLDRRELNPEGLAEAVYFRWLAGERTLVRGIHQVMPSHTVELRMDGEMHRRQYARLRFQPTPATDNWEHWQERLNRTLDEDFARMASIYPRVAVLLSGGVDSALLAAKARHAGFQKCLAVTGHMPGFENPELPEARRVASHLGIEHVVVDVDDSFVEEFFPRFIWRMELLPRNYSGLVLQKLLSRVASEVDAVLFGEGSDSLFGTKEMLRLEQFDRKQRLLTAVPWLLRKFAGHLLPREGGGLAVRLRTLLLHTTADLFSEIDSVDYVIPPPEIVGGLPTRVTINQDLLAAFDSPASGWSDRYQSVTTLSDCKCRLELMDRLSEPLGLVVLTPFFTPGIISLATELPSSFKFRGKWSKPLVRQLACEYFPREWIYAPKLGFPTPLQNWLTGPLNCWVGSLQQERTAARELFHTSRLSEVARRQDRELLWTVLCLETFIREFIDGEGDLGRSRS